MSFIHICRHCRKAVGTVGPYEDMLFNTGDYFLCEACHKEEQVWDEFFFGEFYSQTPLGNDGNK